MLFTGVLCFIVLTSAKGVGGCSFTSQNIPVVPFCKNHIRNGKAIVVASNDVPQNQEVNCVCDVKVAGTEELLVNYESPDYTNCGVQLQIENMLYSCQDSVSNINVSDKPQFQMMYTKSTSTSNPDICILLKSISSDASSIKVTCEETYDQSVTFKPTTVQQTSRMTSSQKPFTQYTDRQKSSESTLPPQVSTNVTSHSSSILTALIMNETTSVVGVTSSPLPFSSPLNASSSTMDTTSFPTTASEYFSTKQSARYKSDSTAHSQSTTDMSTQVPNVTTIKHLTSEYSTERSLKTSSTKTSETTPKKQTSRNPHSSSTIVSPTADWPDSTRDVSNPSAAEGINTTTVNSRQTKEEIQLKTVIIVCSVLGCVLFMSIAVALAIVIYKNRTNKLKNTFNPDIHQSYINAFDQERRESKDDGVFLNNVLLTDHVNDPLKRIYSMPYNVKCNVDITSKRYRRAEIDLNPSVPITDTREEKIFPPRSNTGDVKIPRRYLRTSIMDTRYNHVSSTGENENAKVQQDLDLDHYHDNMYQEEQSATHVWKSTNWTDNGGMRDPLEEKSISQFGGGGKHYQTRTNMNEGHGANDIYIIVRKPREKDQQKKRPKLVTFKGFDDVEEETYNESKGITNKRSTEIHDGDNQDLYDKHSLYSSTKIPRVTLDRDYLYSTVSKVNRLSGEEKVYRGQEVGHV
ncbi:uncharacterized protein LOC123553612 [Mercenaria mercenaria]|uniref:uncharacterized protein LOC123553612 n=1 Tax=Mercenaria mercenaria TaxID=6596 RepID=UPI00234F8E67|nr:uncharacterized protein LOC123553612 [Mercenaria mercenaria]